MINDYEVKSAVLVKYKECLNKARELGFAVEDIPIYFDLKGVCAGMYCWGMKQGTYFRVNLAIARLQLEDYLKRTVPHEVSHHIARTHFPNQSNTHGSIWRKIMYNVYGLEPIRCHSYDIMSIREIAQKRPNKYTCNCLSDKDRIHYLTNLMHNRFMSGKHKYACSRCRAELVYQI